MVKHFYKILFLGLLLVASIQKHVQAAPGDTTVVTAHSEQHLSWYEAYDAPASFPDGSIEYRKIIMEFELGKYMCDGYDPSNPGDSGTGWCADWDYDVHVLVMNDTGDTIELGELITPYANSNFPYTPWSWKHKYYFDVTDYYSVLKDDVTIRIFYAGWSGGFTGTIKFHMIEGPRSRDVLSIQKMYNGGFAYGLSSNPITESVPPVTLTVPEGTSKAVFRTIISGHGGISGSNCAEFCKKWMKYVVNESDVATWDIWRDDCGSNWLHVQSGTWIYDRSNWCPGNKVVPFIQDIPTAALADETLVADIEFQPFSTTVEGASYKMSTYAIFYGEYKHSVDVGVEEIFAPNDYAEYGKINPTCGKPSISVKNYGSSNITSIKIEYGVTGGSPQTKTFSVTMNQDETQVLDLDMFDDLTNADGTNEFYVKIIEVNGEEGDDEPLNNELKSTFKNATKYNVSAFYILFKNSGNFSGVFNNSNWKIINVETNEVMISRTAEAAGSSYADTFWLPNGCYKLEMNTPAGFGLSFFSYVSRGYIKLYNYQTKSEIVMEKSRLGSNSLDGNFGNGFTHYFTINDPSSVEPEIEKTFYNVYPNPAQDVIFVNVSNIGNAEIQVQMYNSLGQIVLHDQFHTNEYSLNVQDLPNGVYHMTFTKDNKVKTEKIIINR